MDHHKKVQTSEAFINSAFLAVSGGFQDAYTYFTRDGVFSNAQTGNVVLISLCQTLSLAPGNPSGRNYPVVPGRLCTGKYECTGYHHGILLLCPAGTDLPKGRGKLLCQYHVHRESSKRYSSFFSLHTRKKAAPASPGTVLLCHYLSVCYRSRNRRTTLCGIR